MTEKFHVYNTEAEAITKVSAIETALGYPLFGRNAATGQVDYSAVGTENWAPPIELTNGKWAVISNDATGEEVDSSLFPSLPADI
jgi:hypothetical protein